MYVYTYICMYMCSQVDYQDISWNHVVNVYEWDLGMNRGAPGLRKLHRLREEHIKLSPRHRMRVKLATQVRNYI